MGNLKVTGNPECLVCGYGGTCKMNALPWVFGDDPTPSPDKFCSVEDQDVWSEAKQLGQAIAEKIKTRLVA